MIERKAYVVRGLVCTPLILILLGLVLVEATGWLQITVGIVTVLAIWLPYGRALGSQPDDPPSEPHQ